MTAANPVLAELLRGDTVESFHRGALAVVDSGGALRAALGDIERPVFPRSAIKVLQALPLVAGGAAQALGLTAPELALACASHSGAPEHVATAAGMLAKAGLDAEALECGVHWPREEAVLKALVQSGGEASVLNNNCSGKHAGFVCVGCLMARAAGREPRAFVRGYREATHPVMREVASAIEAATGASLAAAPVATDGCSIPTWALPLRSLALAFARVGTGQGLDADRARAARTLREAVAAAPFFVAGEGRADTRLMQQFGAALFCKVGAEGVYCAALPALGLGLAIKMDDGNTARAAEVVLAATLQALLDGGGDDALLQAMSAQPQRNWNGLTVGTLRASAGLRQALAG